MSDKTYLTSADVIDLARSAAARLKVEFAVTEGWLARVVKVWAVPRGGVPAAYALAAVASTFGLRIVLVDDPADAEVLFDDIVDSGATRGAYLARYPLAKFEALIVRGVNYDGGWVVFPWEGDAEAGVEDNIVRLLQYCGEDPTRGGLLETPKRVAKAWSDWTSGYGVDPASVLKTFEDGADRVDEMVTVRNISFYSHCEHHMAPFFGTVTIAYIPNGKIVGLSKLARLTNIFAKRLQVQERLTNQIVDALVEHLAPKGAGVVVRARHLCMESRGICQQGSETVTSALRGAIKDDARARAEFMRLL